jgi:hypothetical protein
MITTAAAAILQVLAERSAVEPRIMIVVAHPDDETIGMGAFAMPCSWRSQTALHTTGVMLRRTGMR